MKTRMMVIVAMVGVIAMAGSAMATTFNFNTPGAGAAWNVPGNWIGVPPGPLPAFLPNIGGGDTHNVGPGFSPTEATWQVEIGTGGGPGTATLNVSNTTGVDTLTLFGVFLGRNFNAQVTQTSGTFNVARPGNGMGMAFGGVGGLLARYDMQGGTLNNDGFLYVGPGAGDTGIFEQTGGTVVLGNGTVGDYFHLGGGWNIDNCTGIYEISGGSLTVNADPGLGVALGTVFPAWGANIDGGTGTFRVDESKPGTITGITWNANAYIDGVGAGKGELEFIMDASGVTPITLNGALNLTNSPLLTLDFSALGAVGDILLVDNDGADAIVGTFNGLAEGASVGSGYTLTYVGDTGNDLVLQGGTVVPEPAGLGLIGLALLAVRRRRG